jgi:hypothetical protein
MVISSIYGLVVSYLWGSSLVNLKLTLAVGWKLTSVSYDVSLVLLIDQPASVKHVLVSKMNVLQSNFC